LLVALDVGASVSITSAVVAAVVAILGVMGYQNRRARLSAVRSAFNDVVAGLASDDTRQQFAAAVLLRRFFDRSSELGVRDLVGRRRSPYSGEALSVMAAVLRGLPSGDLQKLLADGLAYAPTLERADLQRTNLQGAYLSPRRRKGTLQGADLYRADVSGGSLKKARAGNAVFYQARLRDTVFRDADLRGANFFDADLTGANFAGARLRGASFALARGVPEELEPFLDSEREYASAEPAPAPDHDRPTRRAVFLSLPSCRTAAQESVCDRITTLLRREGFDTERLPRDEYPPSDAFSEIYRRMSGCVGVISFGMRQPQGAHGESSPGATPWTHVEAGMAYACNLPLLIVREVGVDSGAFDDSVVGHRTFILNVEGPWDDEAVVRAMRPWLAQLEAS
jgi:Pentapeptide repeats (8 copies)